MSLSCKMRFFISICLLLAAQQCTAVHNNMDAIIQPADDERRPCEEVKLSLCKGIEYNLTTFPNMLGHTQQSEAEAESSQYAPLVRVRCSPYVTLFLCSVYAPICTELSSPIRPCRSLCNIVKSGCEPLMLKFGYTWPDRLSCDQFPTGTICVGQNVTDTEPSVPSTTGTGGVAVPGGGGGGSSGGNTGGFLPSGGGFLPGGGGFLPSGGAGVIKTAGLTAECPAPFRVCRYDYKLKVRVNSTLNFTIPDCGAPCRSAYFSADNERFAAFWVGVWAIICTVCCAFTVITCLIDHERFKYPEKPIVFLSGCYLVVAIVYLVGFAVGDSIACQRFNASSASEQQCAASSGVSPNMVGRVGLAAERMSVVVQGTKKETCTIIFMLLYYFQMASSIWYCIICFTWFLSAGLKWVHEAIDSHSQYFHLAAWAIPAGKTIAILATGAVDGDSLSGVCFTGLSDTFTLRIFVIIPLCIYLLFGLVFLISGFVSMFRIRTIIKTGGSRTDKLEKLMLRIGIFSVLYTLPAAALIGCYLYENANRDEWLSEWYLRTQCALSMAPSSGGAPSFTGSFSSAGVFSPTAISAACYARGSARNVPDFPVFLIKYFVTLVVGIATSFWICSGKTITSWKTFLRRLCCCASPMPSAEVQSNNINQQRVLEEHDDSGVVPILPTSGKPSLAPDGNTASNCYPPSYSGVLSNSARPFPGPARRSDKHMLLLGPLMNEDDKDHTAYV